MNMKLRVGMAYAKNFVKLSKLTSKNRKLNLKNKRLKLPKIQLSDIPINEIFRSFCISALLFANVILLIVAVGWFALILSFISPRELVSMYGVEPNQTVIVKTESKMEISDSKISPAPAFSDN